MVGLTIVRVVGILVAITGIAMVRRERENAADVARPVRRQMVVFWVAVAVAGAAFSVWAIFVK